MSSPPGRKPDRASRQSCLTWPLTRCPTLADQAGLSGTDLGIGLAIMRLASLGALPVTGLADRFGRRMLLLVTVGAGLAMTALAAASPSYWWFVAIFACGRPLLSATNGLAQVTAAEQTGSRDRAKAVALIAACAARILD
jgi:MFS family permease